MAVASEGLTWRTCRKACLPQMPCSPHCPVLFDLAPGDQLVRYRDDCYNQQDVNQTTNGGTGEQADDPKKDENYGNCV